ncbi:MAG: hypothetical protein V7774_02270 [Pseudorhizobium pelagicum]|uniref:hypothetical protein n=1 Tax=Pseudorhizobium pelagicum TaxID=1509405 RepID=UPI00346002E6
MSKTMRTATLLAAALALCAGTAEASSDDAWAAFAQTVETKCLAAAKDMLDAPRAVVDPFGSESYGLAIVTGTAKGTTTEVSHICVMDKQTEAAELGSELGTDRVAVPAE